MAIPPPPGPGQPPQYPLYAQGPYATWNQGYSPYNQPTPVNGVAIASLALGLLCFIPAVGLVLGVIALLQIRKNGERGKGMAIAGSVASTLGLALWALLLGTGGLSAAWDGFKDAAEDSNSTFSLEKGDCFDSLDGSLEGYAYDVDIVPCSRPHDGEVFAGFQLPAGSYPGDDRVTEVADEKCYALEDSYAMDSWAVPVDVDVYYLTPTRQSWRLGDREVTCVFGSVDTDGTLTGSLRADETTLNADQLAYLKAAKVLNTAMDAEPLDEYVEDDLPGNKAWAGQVTDALDEQIELLTAHPFTGTAASRVDALLKELRSARTEWAKAAVAPDVDTFYDHYDTGYTLLDPDHTVSVRRALGLETIRPEYESEGTGGEGDSGESGSEDADIQV
ncbi:DUF4190 domain-containing protein [Streptomyces geranii]|uniref:DUF4190 domain-containing protein n=1 Tax=Streptomyces geranii TaxID=2058923 RepID=UPI001E305004|nr:DUF4190 domain-containing protein [Streptomyces geranii]